MHAHGNRADPCQGTLVTSRPMPTPETLSMLSAPGAGVGSASSGSSPACDAGGLAAFCTGTPELVMWSVSERCLPQTGTDYVVNMR